ncbi:Lysophosphatidic acid:oleoyl-CoA acyltransferase 1, partial [Lithohypha guttulata]
YVTIPAPGQNSARSSALESNDVSSDADTLVNEEIEDTMTRDQRLFLDKVAEALARLGRVKRVGLGVKEKQDFIAMWTKTTKRR